MHGEMKSSMENVTAWTYITPKLRRADAFDVFCSMYSGPPNPTSDIDADMNVIVVYTLTPLGLGHYECANFISRKDAEGGFRWVRTPTRDYARCQPPKR